VTFVSRRPTPDRPNRRPFSLRIGYRLALATVLVVAAGAIVLWQAVFAGATTVGITPAPPFTATDLTTPAGANWITVHGDLSAEDYSTLNQITTSNVSGLQLAWQTHLGGLCTASNTSCAQESNALVYQGVMYISDGAGYTDAIDAATGTRIWQYVPTYPAGFTKKGSTIRGIAMGGGMIFVPRMDASVVALNMDTGAPVWTTSLAPTSQAYNLSAPPVYYNGMVIEGMSGGDSGNSDFIVAIDATSGAVLWRWNVVPSPGQPGYKTWGDPQGYHYGGGAIWDAVSVDPKLNEVYVGTGNVVPWNTRPPGSELWTDSIVALNADTGKFMWGYQEVHHDIWDDDVPSTPVLFQAKFRPFKIIKPGTWIEDESKGFYGGYLKGTKFKYTGPPVMHEALAQASKMGFIFILDRKTGKPLIPTPEVPVSDETAAASAGLNLWKTQPIPIGKPFTSQCVLPTQWQTNGPDGKPVQQGCTYTPVGFDHFTAIPHDEGEWMPSALDPTTNTLYTCTIDNRAWAMEAIPAAQQAATLKPGGGYTGILNDTGATGSGLARNIAQGYSGGVTATNLTNQTEPWRNNWQVGDICYSGATLTAGGLEFSGHIDGSLEAVNATTGASLWRSATESAGANAPAITYEANGKQYVSIFAGGDGHENTNRGDLIDTYALPG
jgi:glucose dehydrogenase